MAFCPYCGSDIQPGIKECPICGKKISPQLIKKIESAPAGEWVRAKMIPWYHIGKVAASILICAVLATGCAWMVGFLREKDPPIVQNPTHIATKPSTTTPSHTTTPESTPPATIPDLSDAPVIGNWHGLTNLAELFNEKLKDEYPSIAKYLQVEQLEITLVLQFRADGVMSYHLDQESYKTAVNGCKAEWTDGIVQYIHDEFRMTPEDYEDLTGKSVEAFVDALIEELQGKNIESVTRDSIHYQYQDQQIILEDDLGTFTVEIYQDQMRFLAYTGEYSGASLEIFQNIVFFRQTEPAE